MIGSPAPASVNFVVGLFAEDDVPQVTAVLCSEDLRIDGVYALVDTVRTHVPFVTDVSPVFLREGVGVCMRLAPLGEGRYLDQERRRQLEKVLHPAVTRRVTAYACVVRDVNDQHTGTVIVVRWRDGATLETMRFNTANIPGTKWAHFDLAEGKVVAGHGSPCPDRRRGDQCGRQSDCHPA